MHYVCISLTWRYNIVCYYYVVLGTLSLKPNVHSSTLYTSTHYLYLNTGIKAKVTFTLLILKVTRKFTNIVQFCS